MTNRLKREEKSFELHTYMNVYTYANALNCCLLSFANTYTCICMCMCCVCMCMYVCTSEGSLISNLLNAQTDLSYQRQLQQNKI